MDVETPLHPEAMHKHRESIAQSVIDIHGKQWWVVECRCGRFMHCFG